MMIYDSRLDFWERADNLFNKAIASTANQIFRLRDEHAYPRCWALGTKAKHGKSEHIHCLPNYLVRIRRCHARLGSPKAAISCRSHGSSLCSHSSDAHHDIRVFDCRRNHRCPVRSRFGSWNGHVVLMVLPLAHSLLRLCGISCCRCDLDDCRLCEEVFAKMASHNNGRSCDVLIRILNGRNKFPRCVNKNAFPAY